MNTSCVNAFAMTEYVYPTSSFLLRKYRQTVNHVEEHTYLHFEIFK